MFIDRDRDVPLYRQLREVLISEIVKGTVDVRNRLPSSRELARELGVSRNTVNAAYLDLEAEGFIDAKPRQGYFVNQEMRRELSMARSSDPEPKESIDWSRHLNAVLGQDLPEIAKTKNWQEFPFPFVAGQVNESSFPKLAWARCLREALEPDHLHFSLRDGIDEDDPELIDQLCNHVLPARGVDAEPNQVLVTLGSQQGLDLLAHSLVRSGSVVGVEDPGYPDARHIFSRAGATLKYLPVDSQGLCPDNDLLRGVSLLYLTPSHHSPTNVTLSIARRQHLLAVAESQDMLVVEDDYDSEFRYQGSPTPALKALPNSNRVIYLGTFSKFLAPGLRLGYLVADPELVTQLRRQRRYRVRHPSGHMQRAMALLISSGQYQRTVRQRRAHLSRRWELLGAELQAGLPFKISPPPGGVSIWIEGPPKLDCAVVVEECRKRGVVLERGDVYFHDSEANRRHLRLGFAAIQLDAIVEGASRFTDVVRHQLDS